MRNVSITALLLGLGLVGQAHAQDDFVNGKAVEEGVLAGATPEKAEEPDGWTFRLEVGSNVSVSSASNVVGSVEGTTYQIGFLVNGEARLKAGQHEWNNTLALNHQQTKTPSIDPFVKTADNLELRSMYLYHLPSVPWLGPFARARLQTQVLSGYLIRGEQVDVTVNGAVTREDVAPGTRVDLTSPFEPLLLRESTGFFARPWDSKAFRLTSTLGAGAQQVISQGGFAITDEVDAADGNDKQITLSEIESTNQIGAELEAEATGAINEQVGYTLSANLLYPFVTSTDVTADGRKLEGAALMNIDLGAKLAVKLSKWASLDYVLSARRIPLVLDEWQVTNALLLSATFNVL